LLKSDAPPPLLAVTYEGSEHYNSVRLVNRYYEDDEPGGPISLLRGRGGVAVPGGGDGAHGGGRGAR
jgi:hypothetical protein